MNFPKALISKLNFVFQIELKFMAIGLGFLIYRWQNTQILETELADLTRISAYTVSIFGFINFGIPQIIQKFYTTNLACFEQKKTEFHNFWQAFLVLRLLSYFLGIFLILLTFRLSNTNNLISVIGIFTAQFILVLDISFRSVCDSLSRSWQFSLTDFLGKFLLLLGLFTIFFQNNLNWNFSAFNWFIIYSIIAYFSAFLVDFWLQRDFTWQIKLTEKKSENSLEIPKTFLQNQKNSQIFKIEQANFVQKSVKKFCKKIKTWWQIWQSHRLEIFFLGSSAFITGLFLRTDILFLSFNGITETALIGYSNSYRLFEIASVVPNLIAPVLASQVIQKLKNSQKEKNSQILKSFILKIGLVGLFCTVLLIILAPVGLWIIDPQKRFWNESMLVIWPLSLILICNGLSSFLGNLSIFLGNSSSEIIISLFNLLVATIFYLALIPFFGIFGAALASLFIYLFDLCLRLFFFVKIWKSSQFYLKSG